MSEVDAAIRYIFVLSLILIIVAYWAGFTKAFQSVGNVIISGLKTVTGRTDNGNFAAYPSNAP